MHLDNSQTLYTSNSFYFAIEQFPINPFMPTGTFNICCPRDCVSRHNGGTRGSPIMTRDAVSRTANVGTVGTNGLRERQCTYKCTYTCTIVYECTAIKIIYYTRQYTRVYRIDFEQYIYIQNNYSYIWG